MKKLVIYGAWFYSRVVAETAELCGWSIAGFIDPDPPDGTPTLSTFPEDAAVIAAIGDNMQRAFVLDKLSEHNRKIITIAHPAAAISKSARIGPGGYIAEHAVIRTGARVGLGCNLNSGAIVSHDCILGDAVTFGPNAATASRVRIGDRTLLGVGATVRPEISIGSDCAIGAGAAVVSDFGDGQTAIGVPARSAPGKPVAVKHSNWANNTVW